MTGDTSLERLPWRELKSLRVTHHMRDCRTSRTTATESCSLLTHSSYMGHHINTPVAHPLVSDAIRAWFSHNRRLNQYRDHQCKLQQQYNKCTRKIFRTTNAMNYKISKNDKGEITWRRSWRWPSLKGRTPSISLSSTSVCLIALGLVMFPCPGCLTPSL
jgi:hypothetical protein